MATKKNRLSNLLGSKKEAGAPPQPQETIHPKQSSETNGTTQPDSAYASSENSRDREMQHIDSNNDDGRNLAVDKKTGEVLDEDTGEVVTTVTTTTTTTTVTRTGGKGKGTQVEVTTQPGGGGGGSTSQTPSPSHSPGPAGIAEAPGDSPSTPRQPPTHGQHLSPTDANQSQQQQQQQQQSPASSTSSPAVETQHVYPKAEPQATHPALRQEQQQPQPPNPQIPPRQPHRKSTDRPPPQYTDTNGYKDMPASPSTAHNNFSYPNPNRSQERLQRPSHQTPPPPAPSSPETMHPGYHQPSHSTGADTGSGNNNPLHTLKSAAIGLHGVGETLRGTLNSEVDNRLQRRNPGKNSAAREKNAAEDLL
ncbi:hypothetical protein D0861_03949 [Hortaea werneckii]|uniref:Uncharacterized protein n=1 Tax=Hortaea werneckii TaxID=91943 RepID=A0A3M7FNH9_HORWE|nr:hypothetical protein D0861_03949 [Hortaea werneckii]